MNAFFSRARLALHALQEAAGLWEPQPDLAQAMDDSICRRDDPSIFMRPKDGWNSWREWDDAGRRAGARRVHFTGASSLHGEGRARVWLVDDSGRASSRVESSSDTLTRRPVTALGECKIRLIRDASGKWMVWMPRSLRQKLRETVPADELGGALAWGLLAAGDGLLAHKELRRQKNLASWQAAAEKTRASA